MPEQSNVKITIEVRGSGVPISPSADERVATDEEADKLKAAGWRELSIETLWRHEDHCGLRSVDEALALVSA